jgi:hypothetical protein
MEQIYKLALFQYKVVYESDKLPMSGISGKKKNYWK